MSHRAAHIVVRGLVQGVGYRYFAFRLARQFGLTGWVKNLLDGSVEIEAEGDPSAMDEYVRELKEGPRSSIVRGVDIDWTEATGKYSNFDVRY